MLYLQKGNMQKVVRWFGGKWMTPNQATLFGVVFIILTASVFYFGLTCAGCSWLLLLVPVFLFLRMAMNALDGMLAREYNMGSVAGELWNEELDIGGDMVCYGVLLFVPGIALLPLVLFLILSWGAEFYGVLGKGFSGGIRQHVALLGGKPDRAVWMGLLALMLFFVPGFISYVGYYMFVVSLFVAITMGKRIHKILADTKGKEYKSYTWIGR